MRLPTLRTARPAVRLDWRTDERASIVSRARLRSPPPRGWRPRQAAARHAPPEALLTSAPAGLQAPAVRTVAGRTALQDWQTHSRTSLAEASLTAGDIRVTREHRGTQRTVPCVDVGGGMAAFLERYPQALRLIVGGSGASSCSLENFPSDRTPLRALA